MTSPYVDPRVQKYNPGHQNKDAGIGTVTYAQTLVPYDSEGLKQYVDPRSTPLSGAGKVRNDRKKQNPGFSL